jgi:hypothetical protein
MRRPQSSASLAADALEEAEEMLATLSYTPFVRALHDRLAALKTVMMDALGERLQLTDTQKAKLAEDAMRLACEVAELAAAKE